VLRRHRDALLGLLGGLSSSEKMQEIKKCPPKLFLYCKKITKASSFAEGEIVISQKLTLEAEAWLLACRVNKPCPFLLSPVLRVGKTKMQPPFLEHVGAK